MASLLQRLATHTFYRLQLFNGLFSRTTLASRYQKGKTDLDSNEARNTVASAGQYANNLHLPQTDNHINTQSHNFYRPDALPGAQPTASKH